MIGAIIGSIETAAGVGLVKPLAITTGALLLIAAGLGLYCKTLRAELGAEQIRTAALGALVDQQNQAVGRWKAAAEAQAVAAFTARRQAEQIRAEGEKQAARIISARVPAGCPGAVTWGAGETLRILGGGQ